MKKALLLTGLLLAAASTSVADDRPMHYAAKTPANAEEAYVSLDKHSKEIAAILSQEKVGVAELENVHRISYQLEAAVEWLERHKSSSVGELKKAVLGLHDESERHNEQATRKWFDDVKAALADAKLAKR